MARLLPSSQSPFWAFLKRQSFAVLPRPMRSKMPKLLSWGYMLQSFVGQRCQCHVCISKLAWNSLQLCLVAVGSMKSGCTSKESMSQEFVSKSFQPKGLIRVTLHQHHAKGFATSNNIGSSGWVHWMLAPFDFYKGERVDKAARIGELCFVTLFLLWTAKCVLRSTCSMTLHRRVSKCAVP